jgi:uncharacterized membrane protein
MDAAKLSRKFPKLSLSHHYLALLGILLFGLGLRFWQLDSKPLWLDEVLTALFGSGLNYNIIPKEQPVGIGAIAYWFGYQPASTCPDITRHLVNQSSHPPLFFCTLHGWLGIVTRLGASLAWQLRSLPALLGTVAILGSYLLNRVAFGRQIGLLAATLMAVSPFGVYLSQEARHYTMPLCLTLLALASLVKLEQHLQKTGSLPWPILGLWVAINGLGLYVHYFFLYVFIAQALTFGMSLGWQQHRLRSKALPTKSLLLKSKLTSGLTASLAIATVLGLYIPGLVNMFKLPDQANNQWLVFRPEHFGDWFGPLLRQFTALTTMILAVPMEKQPTWVVISTVLPGLILFGIILIWIGQGLGQLHKSQPQQGSLRVLLSFTLWGFLANLASAYLLRRDLTLGFRYSFTYFPGVVALVAAGLGQKYPNPKMWQRWLVIGAGLCGTIFVVHNLVFLKPFSPDQVSAKVLAAVPIVQQQARPSTPTPQPTLLITIVYDSPMRLAVGISYALELIRAPDPKPDIWFAFVNQNRSASELLQQILHQVLIMQVTQTKGTPLTLWLSGSYRAGKPHVNDSDIVQGLATQGCLPDTQPDFLASQGIEFHLHRCQSLGQP